MVPYEVEVMRKLALALDVAASRCVDAAIVAELVNAEWREYWNEANEILERDALPRDHENSPSGLSYYTVVGPNVWGRGFTMEQAMQAAGPAARKSHIVYKADANRTPFVCVNDMGGLTWRGEEPKKVAEKLPKQKKAQRA